MLEKTHARDEGAGAPFRRTSDGGGGAVFTPPFGSAKGEGRNEHGAVLGERAVAHREAVRAITVVDVRAAVDGHLDRCSSCRAELARLDEGLVALVEALPPEPPSDAVWSAIEARVAGPTARQRDHGVRPAEAPSTRAPSTRAPSTGPRPARVPRAPARRGWPTGLVAALALTVAVGVWGVGQRQLALGLRADLAAARAVADDRIATLDGALADLEAAVGDLADEQDAVARWLSDAGVTVATVGEADAAVGAVLYRQDGAALVVMRGAAGADRSVQAWGVVDGAVTSLGAFEGRVLEVSADGFEAVATLLEPLGGSAAPTDVLGAAPRG